jgi:hypothetical protein
MIILERPKFQIRSKSISQRGSGRLTYLERKISSGRAGWKAGMRLPERVRVYEKLRTGIWSYNGIFHLVDSWQERDEHRCVFKFKLVAVEGDEDLSVPSPSSGHFVFFQPPQRAHERDGPRRAESRLKQSRTAIERRPAAPENSSDGCEKIWKTSTEPGCDGRGGAASEAIPRNPHKRGPTFYNSHR